MNYKESIEVNNFKINEYNNIMVGRSTFLMKGLSKVFFTEKGKQNATADNHHSWNAI